MTDDDKASAELSVGAQGAAAKLSGFKIAELALGILTVFCTSLIIWVINEKEANRQRDTLRFIEQHQTTQAILKSISHNQMLTIEAVKNSVNGNEESANMIVYVLTLTEAERRALKLQMPPGLRRQLATR